MGFFDFRWVVLSNVTGVDWNGPEWTGADIFLREFRLTGFWEKAFLNANHSFRV